MTGSVAVTRIRTVRRLLALLCVLVAAGSMLPAAAAIDLQDFATPEQQSRYAGLIDELRCPKCLNTNLSGSDSPIAADLRRTVARMIREGHTDQEIRDYLLSRYGDFILYRPRLTAGTAVLWFGPGLLLLVGFTVIVVMVRRQLRSADGADGRDSLSEDDAARLAALRARSPDPARAPGTAGVGGESASEHTT